MSEIPVAPIVRIAKEQGAERISEEARTALTEAVEEYTRKLSDTAIDLADHAGRKTVQPDDIELALKHF